MAARATLRVVPALAFSLAPRGRNAREVGHRVVLQVLRSAAASWLAASYPSRGREVRTSSFPYGAAEYASRYAVFDGTSASASASASAVRGADAASASISAVVAPSVSAAASHAAIAVSDAVASAVRAASATGHTASTTGYAAVSMDAAAIDGGASAVDLAKQKLWPDGEPDWARENWGTLKDAIRELNEGWEVWIAWYEARRAGLAADEDLEVARVLIPDEAWRLGPSTVNAEIKRLINLHGRTIEQAVDEGGHWNFFISYSNQDEPIARSITDLIRAAGFSVFAQFSDMPAGSNFVREMQRGLQQSGRLIALYSPAYLKSDQCQAEWSEAYNRDPGGRYRRLIQLLVQATELPALSRQIVHTSLIGLSPADAAAAVLRSIGYEGPLPEIPPGWPGSAAIESIQAASGGIYNVAPGANGLLQRQPTIVSEAGEGAFTPEQLFNDLAREIIELHDYAQKKRGNFSYSDELKARTTRLRESTAVGFSNCDPLALNKQLVWILRAIKYDQRYGLIPDGDAIEFYAADLFGYYNRLEHIFPKLGAYRKMEARQRFTSPTPEVEQAIEIVYGSLSNPNLAQGALSPDLSAELKQAGEGIAEAKKFAEGKPPDETLDVTIESHADAATRSLAVWNWLANAREKFVKSGHKAEDVEKAIANYEKLYKAVSPEMQRYLGYLLKWFF